MIRFKEPLEVELSQSKACPQHNDRLLNVDLARPLPSVHQHLYHLLL